MKTHCRTFPLAVVIAARPGAPIRRWDKNWAPPEGQPYPGSNKSPNADDEAARARQGGNDDRMMEEVFARTNEIPIKSITFLWMQGQNEGTKSLAGSSAANEIFELLN